MVKPVSERNTRDTDLPDTTPERSPVLNEAPQRAGILDGTGTTHTAADDIAAHLARSLGDARYRMIQPMARLETDGEALRVVVASEFHRAWLHRKVDRAELEAAFESARGARPASVDWAVNPAAFDEPVTETPDALDTAPSTQAPRAEVAAPGRWTAAAPAATNSTDTARRRFALDGFVIGDSNRLAYNAALDMARRTTGDGGALALFLHGECGVGKTHLLNAVAAEVRDAHPGARVRSVTGEVFANDFIRAVQNNDFETFRANYRGLDLLCVDDVHFLAGKKKTMNELLHTFDALDLDGARVVLASDEHPKRIERLSQRLVSRCVSGMVVGIDRPDRALRERLAAGLAERRGLRLSDAAVMAVAEACVASVREIEGAVVRIDAYVRLLSGAGALGDEGMVTEAVARRALGATGRSKPDRPVKVDLIAEVICEELGVEPSELYGRGRHRLVVLARSMASCLSRDLTTQSYPEIARALNRRNHSTVVTACQRILRAIDAGEVRDAGPHLGMVHLGELRDRLRERVVRRAAAERR